MEVLLFEYLFQGKKIGSLRLLGGVLWEFEYDKNFRDIGIEPLFNFPETEKLHQSVYLFPHFNRIGWKQPHVVKFVGDLLEQDPSLTNSQLKAYSLREFCEKCTDNPFILKAQF